MTAHRLVAAGTLLVAAAGLTACSGSNSPQVPSIGSSGAHSATSGDRVAALHTAAQCIREHGVPTYQDPVLNAEGQVFTDTRSLMNFAQNRKPSSPSGAKDAKAGKGGSTGSGATGSSGTAGGTGSQHPSGPDGLSGIRQACGRLMAVAGLRPTDQPPAPPRLVQAGVRLAQCLRRNGLPDVQDPTSSRPYSPGHGFPLNPDEVPTGGKENPVFFRAFAACKSQEDEAIRLSTLGNLAHG
jgi:hypothetical protein